MTGSAFDCVFLTILLSYHFHVNSGMILVDPPTGTQVSLEAKFNAINATVVKLQDELTKIKALYGKQAPGIMFMAMFSIDMYNVVKTKPLLFDSVTLNFGNGYNSTTGKFKAPLAGVYVFFVQIQSRLTGYVYARIVKKEKDSNSTTDVAEIFSAKDTGTRDESGSTHVMLTLGVDDEIWVTREGGANNYYGSFRSHFTGFRLPNQ